MSSYKQPGPATLQAPSKRANVIKSSHVELGTIFFKSVCPVSISYLTCTYWLEFRVYITTKSVMLTPQSVIVQLQFSPLVRPLSFYVLYCIAMLSGTCKHEVMCLPVNTVYFYKTYLFVKSRIFFLSLNLSALYL